LIFDLDPPIEKCFPSACIGLLLTFITDKRHISSLVTTCLSSLPRRALLDSALGENRTRDLLIASSAL